MEVSTLKVACEKLAVTIPVYSLHVFFFCFLDAAQVASKLWRRVGRNMDLLAKERSKKVTKMRKAGRAGDIADEEPDLVEVWG